MLFIRNKSIGKHLLVVHFIFQFSLEQNDFASEVRLDANPLALSLARSRSLSLNLSLSL